MSKETIVGVQIVLLIFCILLKLLELYVGSFSELIFVIVVLGTIVLIAYMLKKLINKKL